MTTKKKKRTTADGDRLGAIPLEERPNGKMIAEAQADAEIADWVYAQARIKIRARGGLMDRREAVEQVLKDPDIRHKLLAHMALHDAEYYDFYQRWKASPEKAIAYLDATIAELESPD
jgi:hypothetical protein